LDLQKQITYWNDGAKDDFETVKILMDRNRILHGLFFCHLVVEKSLKAHVVKETGEIAPKSHNLFYLAEKAKIDFNEEDAVFLGVLMKYQLHGRYPDYNPYIPEKKQVKQYLNHTSTLRQWLEKKL